jgi:hypothetical protein
MMLHDQINLLPYPWRDLDTMATPPTTLDLRNVMKPLLEQCESLAASLHGGLHSADFCGEEPANFVPTALLLQETLQAVLALWTAWEQCGASRE